MPYRSSSLGSAPAGTRRPGRRVELAIGCALGVAIGSVGVWRLRASLYPRRSTPLQLRTMAAVDCTDEVVGYPPGGKRYVYCGPIRAIASSLDDEAQVAIERFASPIVGATEVADGWVFVTLDGTVARSDTFIGRLRGVGRSPLGASPRASRGRVALIDDHGALWTTDGRSQLRRANLLPPVYAAAFLDAHRGAALIAGGAVVTSADGGSTWRPVTLGDDVAWDVAWDERGLKVMTTNGRWFMDREGALGGRSCVPSALPQLPPRPFFDPRPGVGRLAGRAREVFGGPSRVTARPELRAAGVHDDDRYARFTGVGGPAVFDCVRGATVAAPRVPNPPPAREPEMHQGFRVIADGTLQTAVGRSRIRRGTSVGDHSAAWRFWEPDGFRVGSTRPMTGDPPFVQVDDGSSNPDPGVDPWWASVNVVTVRGAIVEEEADPWLEWGVTGGRLVALSQLAPHCLMTPSMAIVAALPDAGVAYLLHDLLPQGRGVAVAMEVAPDGRVRARRAVVRGDDTFALARWGATVGIATWSRTPQGARSFIPLDGSPERAFPSLPSGPTRACEAPLALGDPEAITLWFDRFDVTLRPGIAGEPDMEVSPLVTQTEVEWTRSGLCVRSLRAERLEHSVIGLVARPGRGLEGVVDGEMAVHRVACRDAAAR